MNEGTELWDVVALCIDAYIAAMSKEETPPSIDSFIPQGSPQLRNLALVELAKLEMEKLAEIDLPFGIDQYLKKYPELSECTGGAPIDLIIDEIRLRKLKGNCDERSFLDRFPHHRESLKRYFTFTDTTPSSSHGIGRTRIQLQPGQMIEDYELLRLLGTGAFAQVFLARQTTMQRLVALKVSADRGDEAKTLAQLDHPHIVRVYDVRRLTSMRMRLLSMQYAPGGTLQDVLLVARTMSWKALKGQVFVDVVDRHLLAAGLPTPEESIRRDRLSQADWVEAVCWIGIELASALDYAHRHHVLHRDVKPANVLLTSEASCKLADFNISYSGELIGANPSSYFGGSLIYMSPEQLDATQLKSDIRPSDLDERSDVYSLACVIWELLSTTRPWPRDQAKMDWGATVDEIAIRRRSEEPVLDPQVEITPEVERVVKVLRSALISDRDQRMSSAGELVSQLRLCTSPKAWRLMNPELNRWTEVPSRLPILVAAVVVFLPNGLAGLFNFIYNYSWMYEKSPHSIGEFLKISAVVNIVAFSIGAVIFGMIVQPITKEVLLRRRSRPSNNSELLKRTFLVGHKSSIFGVALWLIAGLAFPAFLAPRVPEFDYQSAIHFFLSLAVCGTIAAVYPFLGMSLIAIECWYGLLIGKQLQDDGFASRAQELIRSCDRYLFAASGVPLAGLSLLLGQTQPAREALIGLVIASALGLFLAFRVHQRLRGKLAILAEVVVSKQESAT